MLVARQNLFLVGMALDTERFLVAGAAGGLLLCGVELVLEVKILRLVVQRRPLICVAFRAPWKPLYFLRVHARDAAGIGTGIKKRGHECRKRY
jgi:hypothetical protein